MKKIKLFCLLLLLFSVSILFNISNKDIEVKATETQNVELSIYRNNVAYSDKLNILYAVSYQNIDINTNKVQLLFFDSVQEQYIKGKESYVSYSEGTSNIGGTPVLIYYSNGIAAKEMTKDIYAVAYVQIDGKDYYSEVNKFSVLEYAYKTLENTNTTELMANFMKAMLKYGSLAQQVLNYNTNRLADSTYYNINVVDGSLSDGFTQGRIKENEVITLKAKEKSGYVFLNWTDSLGNIVSTDKDYSFTVTKSDTYTANYQEGVSVLNNVNVSKNTSVNAIKEAKNIIVYNEESSINELNTNPVLSIYRNNVAYSDKLNILYAVSYQNIDINTNKVQLLFFDSVQEQYIKGKESYVSYSEGTSNIGGTPVLIYYSNGIAAKEMTKDIYAVAYVQIDGKDYYSEVNKFSVLEYAYKTLENTNTTELMANFMKAMLKYGSLAQQVLNYNTNRLADSTYYNINVVDGSLSDGFTQGRIKENEVITLKAKEKSGYVFLNWTDSLGNIVSTDKDYSFTVTKSDTYTANYVIPIDLVDIDVNIDYPQKTEKSFDGDNFTYTYYNPSQNKITIKVILDEGYVFGDEFVFIFNNKTIASSKYTINGNVLTYIFDDPNWSIIV